MIARRLAWASERPDSTYPVSLSVPGGVLDIDLETARQLRAQLGAAVTEVEAGIAARAAPSPEAVREAIAALLMFVYLQDGMRGASGAIWRALRALSPELAKVAEDDPHAAAVAVGAVEADDDRAPTAVEVTP